MTPCLYVKDPGLCTTIQDLGRPGFQDMAVPVCGARDPDALRLANALVGNPQNTEGLEISLSGPTFEVKADSVRIALAGTIGQIDIIEPEPFAVPAMQSVTLFRGTVFKVTEFSRTFGCVLAVEGGFALPDILESRSTFMLGKIGGFEGRPLKAGDALPLSLERPSQRLERLSLHPFPGMGDHCLRVVLGPQDNYFTKESIEIFLTTPYTISGTSDRMGLRLEGQALTHKDDFNIVSDGIVTGAVQVPGNGLPIILFNDHQITGGYPKIATVISSDLGRLGRIPPGEQIFFKAVEVDTAENLKIEHEARVKQIIDQMDSFETKKQILDLHLGRLNLIDGIHFFS